eukprot:CAMPEP_0169447236 /NCGR_PEP_ID=MMETSP1042-20121227/11412_1 /TAXON_ID=464988 /ORGANISM="Hemiselmis andersenii, Strain CCMP1180" /LENGTH=761 /DNA_ID=CAMNT_0009558779 /DNA_START=2562 /DNA_END=4848 /DNA_ORIENTATION=+
MEGSRRESETRPPSRNPTPEAEPATQGNAEGGSVPTHSLGGGENVNATTKQGVELPFSVVVLVEHFARVLTHGKGSFFDEGWRRMNFEGVLSTHSGSVIFSSHPLEFLLLKKVFQVIVLVFGLIYFSIACNAVAVYTRPAPKYTHFRYASLENRLGNNSTVLGVSAIGILDKMGHPVMPSFHSSFHESRGVDSDHYFFFDSPVHALHNTGGGTPSVVLRFTEGVEMGGWFFNTSVGEGTENDDPSFFTMHGSNDGEEWTLVGSPETSVVHFFGLHRRQIVLGSPMLAVSRQLTRDRGATVIFDTGLLLGEVWFMYNFLTFFLISLGFLVAASLGAARMGAAARAAMACFFFCGWVVSSICIAVYSAGGFIPQAIQLVKANPTMLLLTCAVFFEQWFLGLFTLACVTDLVLNISLPDAPVVFFELLLRLNALRRSSDLIKHDMQRYEEMWASEEAADVGIGNISRLAVLIDSIGLDSDRLACRQCERRLAAGMDSSYDSPAPSKTGKWEDWRISSRSGSMGGASFRGRHLLGSLDLGSGSMVWRGVQRQPEPLLDQLMMRTVPGVLDIRRPVSSLDQMYACASVLHTIVLPKVKDLAREFHGYFPRNNWAFMGRGSYVKFSEVEAKGGSVGVKWSGLKSSGRAIEKITRSLGNDPSYLTDICRFMIAFENFEDLTKCLATLLTDEEVRVIRIKNRYSPDYDAAKSAGYRDVAINFRIKSDATLALGAEVHICELQLILLSFAEIRSVAGHRNYIQWRNFRGE